MINSDAARLYFGRTVGEAKAPRQDWKAKSEIDVEALISKLLRTAGIE